MYIIVHEPNGPVVFTIENEWQSFLADKLIIEAGGGMVFNPIGELLMMLRRGQWDMPKGKLDEGETIEACALREVEEETGIIAEPLQLLGVVDGMRMGFSRFGMYMLLFHLRATGGELQGHPLETGDVGWFGPDELPTPTAGAQWWGDMAFAAIAGDVNPATFDAPREHMWRGDHTN